MKNSENLSVHPAETISRKVYIYTFLIYFLIATLLFNGFITNFLSVSQTNLGTVIIDLIMMCLLLHLTIKFTAGYYKGLLLNKVYFSFLVFWLLLLLLTATKLLLFDSNPFSERFLGVRNNLLYMLPVVYIPLFFRREKEVSNVLSLFLNLSLLLVFFSFVQFFLSSWLPQSLLVLRGDSVFSFYGTTIARTTALLGNTIIFASFTIILFSIYLSKYLYQPKRKYLILLFIIGLANILTFTRASIVGLVIVMLVALFLRYGRFSLSFMIKIAKVILLLIIMGVAGLYFYKDSFLVARLTGKEASTQGSTSDHMMQIKNAVSYMKAHPIVGAGIGSQGASGDPARKIITDGYWFQVMLENGMPLGLVYIGFYISCVVFALSLFYRTDNLQLKQLCMAFVAFSAYFYTASFLNSGFTGRANYITFWILLGILIAQYIVLKRTRYAVPSR